jgi:hypothetical protein
MSFYSQLYTDVYKSSGTTREIIEISSYILFMGLVVLQLYGFNIPEMYVFLALLGIFLINIWLRFSAIYRTIKYEYTFLGTIEITNLNVKWKDLIINWDNIDTIIIKDFDIKGALTTNRNAARAAGLENEITIVTTDKENYHANFLIRDETHARFLKSVLWETIKCNTISFENAKNMLNPANYQEFQEIKKYCK